MSEPSKPVWIVLRAIYYDDHAVAGVFDNRQAADECARINDGSDPSVEEWPVDSEVVID